MVLACDCKKLTSSNDDIDSKRMMVHIHRGKGAKDRMFPLAEPTLLHLREYYKSHFNPKWIFPTEGKNHSQAKTSDKPLSTMVYLHVTTVGEEGAIAKINALMKRKS